MAEPSERPPVPDPTVLTTDQLDKLEARIRTTIDERFASYDKTVTQMFASVDRRFKEMTDHRLEQKQDTTKALDAALNAAKEAVTGVDARVNDVRDRVTRVEASLEGKQSQVVEARNANAATGGNVALGFAAVVALVGVISFILALANGTTP